ncbi:MAG: phosphatase PAP2 family protein [Anaeroplasmataceae bacterium]|jgi:Membrane-associated phospholipid phosphatase|nr:phosphatase PAP2 family protein [Anaeroplasmataceae bacterium]
MKKINWKLYIKIAGIVLCMITFIILAIFIYLNRLEPLALDVAMRDFSYNIRGDKYGFGYWFFRLITEFGNVYIIVGIVVFSIIVTRCDYRAILLTLGILGAVLLNVGLKEIYMRERPIEAMRWMDESSTSFPSGHSTAVGFLYTFIMYLVYHSKVNKVLKRTTYTACLMIIPLVMFSRLILGVHYFTDVLAGVSVGIMVACLCMMGFKLCERFDFMTEGLFDVVRKNKTENK